MKEPKSMINNNSDKVGSHQREDDIMNVEDDDRLSTLPNDLIYKILSFVSIEEAIETSFLSSRWRSIWISIPNLNFVIKKFFPRHRFSKFVPNLLSRRNDQMQVSSVKLKDQAGVSHDTVKRIVKYAVSHNVQQLTLTCDFGSNIELFPLSEFSSKSLKHLTFAGAYSAFSCAVSPTWEPPALRTLHFELITLSDHEHHTTDNCIGFFSKCPNLNSLYLKSCKIEGTNVFNIFHPTLSNLTLESFRSVEVFNVVTPQLKNLTISYCYGKNLISAPQLTSLVLNGGEPLQPSTEGFPFLDKLDLCIYTQTLAEANKMVCLLQHLHTVRFLTLDLSLLKILSSSKKLISHQPSAFRTFKISKFLPIHWGMVYMEAQEKVIMTSELKSQTTSLSAIFPLISCQEIEVMRKMVFAQEPIYKLREWVKSCKGKRNHMRGCKRKRGKVQVKKHLVKSAFEMQWHFEEMMTQIEQGIIDGYVTEELSTFQTRSMISRLQCVEELLTELPASKRSALQATFSSMCAEAAFLMNNMLDGMKKHVILKSSRSRKPKLNQDPSFIYD